MTNKQTVMALQIDIERDASPRLIPEDVEIALDKVARRTGWELPDFDIDEAEDFSGRAIMVQRDGGFEPFEVDQNDIAELMAQITEDTGAVVGVRLLD